jgi:hypothetical protein
MSTTVIASRYINMMRANSACLVGLAVLFSAPSPSIEKASWSSAMSLAIQQVVPGATIVAAADIDMTECDQVPDSPGIVVADFSGDGRKDVAFLAKTGETGKVVKWQGRDLKMTRYVFGVLVENGKGGFSKKLLRRFEDYAPIAAFIDVQTAGIVRDRDTGKDVKLRKSAVALIFCGKSAELFHLVRGRVATVQLAD